MTISYPFLPVRGETEGIPTSLRVAWHLWGPDQDPQSSSWSSPGQICWPALPDFHRNILVLPLTPSAFSDREHCCFLLLLRTGRLLLGSRAKGRHGNHLPLLSQSYYHSVSRRKRVAGAAREANDFQCFATKGIGESVWSKLF